MDRKILTLAGTLAAALAAIPLAAQAGPPAGREACYGISMAGHNDCAAGVHDCAGKASADYRPADFKYVPAGTCEKMNVGGHKGSLTPA